MNEKLQAARTRLVFDRPYLAAALWSMQPIERPGIGTLAVDARWRLYYDPQAVEAWPREHATGVLYHEVLHLLRDHAGRCQALGAGKVVWNLAVDCEVNDDLLAEGVKLPGDPVLPRMFGLRDGLLAEEYYAELIKRAQPQPSGGGALGGSLGASGVGGVGRPDNCGGGRTETEQGRGGGKSGRRPAEGQARSSGGPGRSARDADASGQSNVPSSGGEGTRPDPGKGNCGSCAHGQREAWEEPLDGSSDTPGISQAEAEIIRRQVAVEIREHAKTRGNVPEHLKRWAEEKLTPKVDWRRALAAVVRASLAHVSGAVDYSYSKPSRRQGQVGNGKVIFPALRRPAPEVAVVVDTSGSISDRMLAQALAEVRGVLLAVGVNGATVLAVDAAVHTCRRVFDAKQVQLAGGGGTDMGVGIAHAMKLKPRPQVVVVLTDGYTPWPDSPPNARVVVGLIGDGPEPPDWARCVRVEV